MHHLYQAQEVHFLRPEIGHIKRCIKRIKEPKLPGKLSDEGIADIRKAEKERFR